jgi:hypothetical protein
MMKEAAQNLLALHNDFVLITSPGLSKLQNDYEEKPHGFRNSILYLLCQVFAGKCLLCAN